MCLDATYKKTAKAYKKIMEQARRRGYIRVYKVCSLDGKTGWYYGLPWMMGIGTAGHGWYGFLTRKGAERWCKGTSWVVKTCYAKSGWIKQIGRYDGKEAVLCSKLAFPDWGKGNMTIKEFREMCRKEK